MSIIPLQLYQLLHMDCFTDTTDHHEFQDDSFENIITLE